jgi:hypothetical protein
MHRWKCLLGDGLEGNSGVSDSVYGAGIASGGLDADTIYGVLNHVVGEGYSVDDIVTSAAHGAYRQTVAT